MWQCACVCIGLVARADASDLCDEMPIGALYEAGFITEESPTKEEEFNWFGIVHLLIGWLVVLLILGKYLNQLYEHFNLQYVLCRSLQSSLWLLLQKCWQMEV